jgi:hypothetical protein
MSIVRNRSKRVRRGWPVVLLAAAGLLLLLLLTVRLPASMPGRSPPEAGGTASAERSRLGARWQQRAVATVPTSARLRGARRFARGRAGLVSFAVVDSEGRLRCGDCRRRYMTASLVSDAAKARDDSLGDAPLYQLARRTGMRHFDVHGYRAGARLSAADQARVVARLDRLTPRRHRGYARTLMSSIAAWRDWGIPEVSRQRGWRTLFEGDSRAAAGGQLVHQIARLERRGTAITIAVLTDGNPSQAYGRDTVRGIAARLLGASAAAGDRRSVRRSGSATGRLVVVPGHSETLGRGPVRRFIVEVEEGLHAEPAAVAGKVEQVLSDRRGWGGSGRVAFRRVSRGPASLRVALASPSTTDQLCLPLLTNGIFSCYMAGRAVLNAWRWRHGAAAYAGRLRDYRTHLVNHEVGHALGLGHAYCPGGGQLAPVMMQQTKGVAPCRANPRPLPNERP